MDIFLDHELPLPTPWPSSPIAVAVGENPISAWVFDLLGYAAELAESQTFFSEPLAIHGVEVKGVVIPVLFVGVRYTRSASGAVTGGMVEVNGRLLLDALDLHCAGEEGRSGAGQTVRRTPDGLDVTLVVPLRADGMLLIRRWVDLGGLLVGEEHLLIEGGQVRAIDEATYEKLANVE